MRVLVVLVLGICFLTFDAFGDEQETLTGFPQGTKYLGDF